MKTTLVTAVVVLAATAAHAQSHQTPIYRA